MSLLLPYPKGIGVSATRKKYENYGREFYVTAQYDINN